ERLQYPPETGAVLTVLDGREDFPTCLTYHCLTTLMARIPSEFPEALEGEKRGRCVRKLVRISPFCVPEDLERKAARVLDVLDVGRAPPEVYRMGRPDTARPRLVKIVFLFTVHYRRALANAQLLRHDGFPDVFIRKSMTAEERKNDFETCNRASERNRGKGTRDWVVFGGGGACSCLECSFVVYHGLSIVSTVRIIRRRSLLPS
ncbi:unnamed protein product, partial [Nippostrongylus brasiliensis]|uniref:RNA-dependent RNA polymerase n=1 Tax=Nippostrongylus brasiliensis TaxID=27835 RepID=A0A0N4YCM2_NIPBR